MQIKAAPGSIVLVFFMDLRLLTLPMPPGASRRRAGASFLHILVLLLILPACSERTAAPVDRLAVRVTETAIAPQSPGAADPASQRLQAALAEYRRIEAAGGWPIVPSGPKLELGATGSRVARLRQRLVASGDLVAAVSRTEVFDADLAASVRRFQARHGLLPDGVVGPETLAALDVPVGARIATIRLNLDRTAGEAREWGSRYIAVNVPAASYQYVNDGRPVLAGPVVAGRPSWPTPRVESVITQMEFNPYWNVPASIAQREIWPIVRRDPGYLARNHMRVIEGRIRQDPGPGNPLGAVKFIFASPYDVYLHDTNNRALFDRPNRLLSHGCVRVSRALDLARQLLATDPDWTGQRIDEAVASGRTVRVALARPIALHIVYDTAWVDEAGIVQFRKDVYGLDRKLLAVRTTAADGESSSCGGAEH